MAYKIEATRKQVVIQHWDGSKKYMMAPNEYVGVVVGKEATDGEYVISDGVMAPGGAVPDHYHKWEDQTFHILQGTVDAKLGDTWVSAGAGDTIHCPRGVSHYMKNNSDQTVCAYDQLHFPRRPRRSVHGRNLPAERGWRTGL